MSDFTPLPALLGGALIGLAAAALLLFHGRLAGISGALAGILLPRGGDVAWRVWFLGGMVAGGLLLALMHPSWFAFEIDRSLPILALAGVCVGFGTRLGGGCTSGHGVCGVSRFTRRSIAATCTFVATGIATVFVFDHLLAGLR